MDLPRVLIMSTASVDRAKNIGREEMGSEHLANCDNVDYHVWTIDNKYYSAKVLLCFCDKTTKAISNCGIEAIVLHHDSKEEKDVEHLDAFLPLVRSMTKADIFLLACEPFENLRIREKVTEWSQMHKFEMVEMECPNASNDVMDEETDDNIYGIERITEALNAHLWPNRILKGEFNPRIESSEDIEIVEDQLESMRINAGTRENPDQLLMESVLDGIMGEENTDFGELFGRLMDMKEHASTLSSNNRRAAAEQLVTVFWKAMGGEPSEVEDLDH